MEEEKPAMNTDAEKTIRPQETELQPGDEANAGAPGTGEDICRNCEGGGQIKGQPCPTCGGTGRIVQGVGGA
jgi:RecJ-like exonuclease